jgi:uncharacterized Zn finger protein (UPF0148 family)
MTKVSCYDCGFQIDGDSVSCPKCGTFLNLSDYERREASHIWQWKNRKPSIFSLAAGKISAPMSWAIKKMIPAKAIIVALEGADFIAKSTRNQNSILKLANVPSVDQLRELPLDLNDALADQIHNWAVAAGTAEGAITGAAGIFGIIPDLPALCTIALRTVHRIGIVYGYEMATEADSQFAYAVLSSASANSIDEKVEALATLRSLQVTLAKRTWISMYIKAARDKTSKEAVLVTLRQLAKQMGINLTKRRALAAVPAIGMAIGGSLNGWYIREVSWAARRAFQERRLLEHGKIRGIPCWTDLESD